MGPRRANSALQLLQIQETRVSPVGRLWQRDFRLPHSISEARPKSPTPSKPEGQTLPLSPTPRATCQFHRATRHTPTTELLSVHFTQNTVLRKATFLRSR